MAYPLINGAVINGAAEEAGGLDLVTAGTVRARVTGLVPSARPLEFGVHRLRAGVDQAMSAFGLDLVRTEYHSIRMAAPSVSTRVQAAGARPLQFGSHALVPATVRTQAPSATPLEIGSGMLRLTAKAPGALAFDLGGGALSMRVHAPGARPLEFGGGTMGAVLAASGLDLVRSGTHRVRLGGFRLQVTGAWPLEFGSIGAASHRACARQAYPLQMGSHSLVRETAC